MKVMISCPGDVEAEKAIVERICEEINRNWETYTGVHLEHFEWKKDVVPRYGPRPQDVINEQVGQYDVYIGILWGRFGTPTGIQNPATGEEFNSGTEEEFSRALDAWKTVGFPVINVYFKTPPPSPHSQSDIDQISKLLAFKEKIKTNGWVIDFGNVKEFGDKVRQFLSHVVQQSKKIAEIQRLKVVTPQEESIDKPFYEDVKDYIPRKVIKAEESASSKSHFLLDRQGKRLLDIIEATPRILLQGEAGIGKSSELQRIAHELSKGQSLFIPVLVSLNKYVNQELANYLPSLVNQIPPERAVIILDGLDEVESQNKNTAIRHIESYVERNPLVRMIISCRDNLSQPIEGFHSYYLLDLSGQDIKQYIKTQLGARADDFDEKVFAVGVQDLLRNPFYLSHLVKVFQKTNSPPNRKVDIIKTFIETRITIDENKYRTTIIDFLEKKKAIIRTLEKLSLTMEILGRNYLSQDDFLIVVPDELERDIIKHSGLLKRNESEVVTWQFEHNNFQEYFAASVLSRQSIGKIKELTAFKPDFRKTKPSWLNTLSFLFNLSDDRTAGLFNELLDWILSIEQELLVKCEPGRVDLHLRIEIFKRIFEDYKRKGVWIDHERFLYSELSRFAESDEITNYLLNEIKTSTNDVTTGNAIHLLQFMAISHHLRRDVTNTLLDMVLDTNRQTYTRSWALNALTELGLGSRETAKTIVPALRQSKDTWIRYSLYKFLYSTDIQDEYVDVFIEGIPCIRLEFGGVNNTERRLGDESYHLNNGIQKITSPAALDKVLEYFKLQPKELDSFFLTDDLPPIVENAARAFKKEPSIYDHVFSLFLELVKEHQEKEATAFLSFFDQTETRAKAFREVYQAKQSIGDWYLPLATLADSSTIEFIIDEYLAKHLTDDDIWTFRNFIGWKNMSVYDLFHKRLNERTGNKFELPKPRDFEAKRKKRFSDDLRLLFDREGFLAQIKLIYDREGKEMLTKEDLLEIRTKHWEDKYFSDIAFDTLRDLVEKGLLTFNDINDEITTKWSWDYFIISEIHRFMSNGREVDLDGKQIEFIKEWCLSNVDKVDFTKALKRNEDGGSSTSHLAVILWFFIRKMKVEVPKNVLLDLISFDWVEGHEMGRIAYLEECLSVDEISERILDNLVKGIETDDVLRNHLDFCKRYQIREVIPFAIKTIEDESRDQGTRRVALDTILAFAEAIPELEKTLAKISDDFKWQVVEKLVQLSSQQCRSYLAALLTSGVEEDKFKASQFLVELQDLAGLRYYVKYIKQTKRSPIDSLRGSPIIKLKQKEAIPLLLELLEVTYQEDFVRDEIDRLDMAIRGTLQSIAINHGQYDAVRESVIRFIEANFTKYPKVNFLYAFLETLERAYYINKAEEFTLEEALDKAKSLVWGI